ncbi:MAG TPA: LysR substrate-binding domain-containing protein [Burkholderiaceae bacterium]|nr:LysR substrate-binding domain-containing protein [Burkholderiaceae bacterium]
MDQLRSLRVFVRVIDEGSFAGAARVLDLAPAVVTRVVAELEEHLGARLLNRTTRRLALTEIGETYLERARRILVDVEEADALAGASTAEARGTLRVLAPPAFAVHQLAKHLPRFREKYPRVNLELTLPGPVETLDENFDVSILSTGQQTLQGDFVARPLACSEFVACAAPSYLDRRGRPQHPNDLAQHDGVLPATSATRRALTLYRGKAGDRQATESAVTIPTPSAALTTSHIDTIYSAALAGLGIAGLPSFVIEEALRRGTLERVLPQWRGVTLTLYAAMPTRRHAPARTRVFIDFLVQTFGGQKVDPWLRAAGRAIAQRGRP